MLHMCTSVEVRGQSAGVTSFLPLCGFLGQHHGSLSHLCGLESGDFVQRRLCIHREGPDRSAGCVHLVHERQVEEARERDRTRADGVRVGASLSTQGWESCLRWEPPGPLQQKDRLLLRSAQASCSLSRINGRARLRSREVSTAVL